MMLPESIVEDETGKEFFTLVPCQACRRTQGEDWTHWIYNKQSGIVHLPGEYDDVTACGKDCTGKTWLHRL